MDNIQHTSPDFTDDSWIEVNDDHVERAGIFNTLFTSPDFTETHECQTVYEYGHIHSGQSDNIHTFFAPAEHNIPYSVFLHLYSEQLTTTGILLFSRSLTPITATHHKHLSSAQFLCCFISLAYVAHQL